MVPIIRTERYDPPGLTQSLGPVCHMSAQCGHFDANSFGPAVDQSGLGVDYDHLALIVY